MTCAALMQDNPFTVFALDVDRLHQPAAIFRAIPRIDIDMTTVKTMRAMIGIAVARYRFAAMATGEILDFALEFFCHLVRFRVAAIVGMIMT